MYKRIGIISKPKADAVCSVVPPLLAWLRARGAMAECDPETASCLPEVTSGVAREELLAKSDLLIVLGGDGTLLALSRSLTETSPPILPINLGGLGFLTSVTLGETYQILEEVFAGTNRISERVLLQAEIQQGDVSQHKNLALNDVVITKAALSRIIELDLSIDESYVCSYKADGLIVSTPTGSTAYSLAAGGPIVYPVLDAFVITPICPHALTNRPLVVPDRMHLQIAYRASDSEVYLTLDGQVGMALERGDRVRICKSDIKMRLVRPSRRTYFEILRSKLKWGAR